MRGDDANSGSLFSYIDLEKRVAADHPLRVIREIATRCCGRCRSILTLYSPLGGSRSRRSGCCEPLLLQAFYSIRSERQLIERIDYD